MSTRHDDAFDGRARAAHAASLDALPPRVQAQLAQRRRAALDPAPAPARRAPWGWATAAASACVLVVALQVRPPVDAPVTAAPVRATAAVAPAPESAPDPGAMLAEEPEFYAWLASSESSDFVQE